MDLWVCRQWKLIDLVDVLEMEKKRMGGRAEQKRIYGGMGVWLGGEEIGWESGGAKVGARKENDGWWQDGGWSQMGGVATAQDGDGRAPAWALHSVAFPNAAEWESD